MTRNADAFGPDREVLEVQVFGALTEARRWRDVQAACIASYVCDGLPVPVSHVSQYKAALEDCRRLSDFFNTLCSVRP